MVSYGRKPDSSAKPEYFDICYVIDKSGSMAGNRMTTAKGAILHFIEAMYSVRALPFCRRTAGERYPELEDDTAAL